MNNFFSPALVVGAILGLLAGGCADKPLPIPPGIDSPTAKDGQGRQISQEGLSSSEGDQTFGIPSPLGSMDSRGSVSSSNGGIQEDTMTSATSSGSSDNNDFAGAGFGGSGGSKDDFISGPLTGGDFNSGTSSSEGQIASMVPFHTTESLKDIFFSYDKHDLTKQSKSILARNANWLKENPNVRVEIAGHCDERGTNNYNLSLGERRAQSTKNYLVSLGVSQNRIYTISYGEEKPFCLQNSEDCWWQNRRGHFMISRR